MISYDVENPDGIAESSHKHGIYCITRNVTEFAKFWMDKWKVGQYTWIKMQHGLVSVNVKPKKNYLNMNPTCSARLCVNEWHRCAVSFTIHILYTYSALRITLWAFYHFFWEKLSSYLIQTNAKVFTATHQNKSLVKKLTNIFLNVMIVLLIIIIQFVLNIMFEGIFTRKFIYQNLSRKM